MRRLAGLGIVVLVLVLVLLVLAQLLLPGIAAQRLRDHLAQNGQVEHVEVHAFPAVKLLWHHADRVVVRMASYQASASRLGSTLDGVSDVGTLDASAGELRAGLLTLRDASLQVRNGALTGSALVQENDLRAAVPFISGVQPVAEASGQLVLRGTATVLGASITADGTVAASGGSITVTPDVPFGGLATVTVFSDRNLQFTSLAARPGAGGFALTATARTR